MPGFYSTAPGSVSPLARLVGLGGRPTPSSATSSAPTDIMRRIQTLMSPAQSDTQGGGIQTLIDRLRSQLTPQSVGAHMGMQKGAGTAQPRRHPTDTWRSYLQQMQGQGGGTAGPQGAPPTPGGGPDALVQALMTRGMGGAPQQTAKGSAGSAPQRTTGMPQSPTGNIQQMLQRLMG